MWVEICFFLVFSVNKLKGEEARKLGQNLAKKEFFEFAPKHWSRFFSSFQPFNRKNVAKENFDQDLEYAAPKRWSKYITISLYF